VSDSKNWKLPKQFGIYSHDRECDFPVEATVQAENDGWTETELLAAVNARRQKRERIADFKARLKWLESAK
jgi:hypothetical protein